MSQGKGAVAWSVKDGLATIRLEGDHGNAINDDLVDGLMSTFHEAEANREIRGVLLTSGGKLFSPGLDLRILVSFDRPRMARFLERFSACLVGMFTLPKPVVAAIPGHALAGGCVLILTTDWRILKEGAAVGLNEIKVGVPLPFGVSLMLREAVRTPRMEEVALLGRNYTGAEAVSAGVVHEIHGAEGFESYCMERLREFADRDLRSYAATKRYLRSATVERIRANDSLFREEFLDCWFSEGTRARIDGIIADLERRKR